MEVTIKMISVSFKRRNLCSQSIIAEALNVAYDYVSNQCQVFSIGYDIKCDNCAYKQGCRDIHNSARYAEHKYVTEVSNNENY